MHLIKVGSPIQSVFRSNEQIVDHIESGCESVLPKVYPSDMAGRIVCFWGVMCSARPDITNHTVIITAQILTTTTQAKPVVELVLGISSCPIPMGVDIRGAILRRSTDVPKDCVKGQQQLVLGKFRGPISPRIIEEHVG